jgi:hypothetical protein
VEVDLRRREAQKARRYLEWTSTDVDIGGQTYKALCGPGNSCDCSHRDLPEWKNEVKGFRCVQDSTPVTWLPMLFSCSG